MPVAACVGRPDSLLCLAEMLLGMQMQYSTILHDHDTQTSDFPWVMKLTVQSLS
jgi:hypothetical protein